MLDHHQVGQHQPEVDKFLLRNAGDAETDNPLASLVEDLQAQLSVAKASAAEYEGKSLELGAELAVMERKQKNQVLRACGICSAVKGW